MFEGVQMNDLVDEKKIITQVTERALERAIRYAESQAKEIAWQFKRNKKAHFHKLISRQRRYVQQVTIPTISYALVNLDAVFAGTDFHFYWSKIPEASWLPDDVELNHDTIVEAITDFDEINHEDETRRPAPAILVTGSAGSGKSIFMRHFYLQIILKKKPHIPIFIELRNINQTKSKNFKNFILEYLQENFDPDLSSEGLTHGLESGIFFFVLDGSDEIDPDRQSAFVKELLRFSVIYDRNPIIISGRYMEAITGLTDFENLNIRELDSDKSLKIIQAISTDQSLIGGFLNYIKKIEHEKLEGFSKNPLLLIVMFFTFQMNGEISLRRHEFFEDAMSTLFYRHDARKDGFERKMYTGLERGEMIRFCAAFAARTYARSRPPWSLSELTEIINKASKLAGIDARGDLLRKDLVTSLGLIVENNGQAHYSHRLFEEYLCA